MVTVVWFFKKVTGIARVLAICACIGSVVAQAGNLQQAVGLVLRGEALTLNSVERDSIPVRLMTWNIRYNNPDDGVHAWPHRRDDVLSFVRSQKLDVLCIQEGLHDQVTFLQEGLSGFEMCGVGRDDGNVKGEYSAIFFNSARFTSVADGTFWLSSTPSVPSKGWDAALPRIVTWVRLFDSLNATTLCVLNTHFDHQGEEARKNSAHLLRLKIDEIAGGSAVLVAGDFNATDTEAPYRILTSADLPSPVLEDAMRHSRDPSRGGPSTTFAGFEPTEPITGPRIDYVFVSESVCVLRYSTYVPMGKSGILSDHLPVGVEVTVPSDR